MTYSCTILRAKPGKRLAKRYRDPAQAPDDYDAGALFTAREETFATFAKFVSALGRLRPDECLIRGVIKDDARTDVEAGLYVRRLEYAKGASDPGGAALAAFEPAERNWIVLDLDESDAPFDPEFVEESIAAWRDELPPEICDAQSAFFLSASSHRRDTLRGKLVVALAKPISNREAEAWAKAHGFDGSVCRTVQPNYFAAPVFEGCEDPLEGKRAPIALAGKPARLRTPQPKPSDRQKDYDDVSNTHATDLTSPTSACTERVLALAQQIYPRWLAGDRMCGNGWLHLASWLLGKDWSLCEVASLLDLLDTGETDARKRQDHKRALLNAKPLSGPGGAREWLADDFDSTDVLVSSDPVATAYGERREAALRAAYAAPTEGQPDPWTNISIFGADEEPVEYVCEDLRLAPSKGKISIIAGNAAGGKGPIADHLAVCFALGEKAFGACPCKQAKVLVLDYEGARMTRHRMRRMARALGHDPAELDGKLIHLDVSTTGDATEEANQAAIARAVKQHTIEVVFLDSYTSAMLASETDANSPQYARLAQQLGQLGITVIAVAHSNKANARGGQPHLSDISGSGALGALSQTAIFVHYPDEADKFRIQISCGRAPETPFATFDVECKGGKDEDFAIVLAKPIEGETRPEGIEKLRERMARTSKAADRIEDLLLNADTMGTGMRPRKIRDALGISGQIWADAIAECQRRGRVTQETLPSDTAVTVRLVGLTPTPTLPEPGEIARPTGRSKRNARDGP
jgi:hypothetical protein